MEWLDIVDENGEPTGERVERADAHARGVRHRTAHVWLLRFREGRIQVLLQKRSPEKDSFPGCYDISSAGHIPAGADYIPSALRELREELGLSARPEELRFCGTLSFHARETFRGKPFLDEQVSRVYALWRDAEPAEMTLQAGEVASVLWIDYEACRAVVGDGSLNSCIRPEELDLLRRAFPAVSAEPGDSACLAQLEFTNAANKFMRFNRIRVERLSAREAVLTAPVTEDSLNTGTTVHGGLFLTMADCAVSALARCDGRSYVTTDCNMHFIRNVTRGTLTARAEPISRGRRVFLARVRVFGGDGTLLLTEGTASCFCTDAAPAGE